MKKLMSVFLSFLSLLGLFTACTKETQFVEDMVIQEIEAASRNSNPTAQAIVLAAPSVNNTYYRQIFQDIVDFQIDFANKIEGRDAVIILVDQATRKYYEGKVPDYVLVEANIGDIWIRDFSPVVAGKQVKFNYLPDYLSRSDANYIDNSFEKWHQSVGLQYGKKSTLIKPYVQEKFKLMRARTRRAPWL